MTFLEFVATRLMGPPSGTASWHCPFCASRRASLTVRPPKGDYPIKFCCHRCSMWGDEFDLLKEFYPGDDYPRRRARIDAWRKDWEREQPPEPLENNYTRGRGVFLHHNNGEERAADLEQGFLELVALLKRPEPTWATEHLAGLRALVWACAIADEQCVSLSALASRCARELLAVKAGR